jgi:phenylalanyl-tRNA synthetase beta chain
MRVPLSWLREYVDVDLTPEQLAERLTLLGMEVKGIERRGVDWRNVVVGELLTVSKHPRADRLSLTTVTTGSGEVLEIVCGATNIAPGQRVPVALPGAVLPGDRRIERTEKMGVVSNGMLCSGDELGLTSDADGILILSPETPLGAGLEDLYGDVILDVDVKPNRGDALSIVGLAREVAAIGGGTLRWPDIELAEAGRPVGADLSVAVEDPGLCPRFVGRVVRGVRVGPSPDRIQMRLLAAGIRPVSNVVDATNYVMVELGKPIHAFDAAAVTGGRIVVRRAHPGERLETLDHVDRELDADTIVIADASGPIGMAGIMGGAGSEVGPGTTDVVVESAIFDPVTIRRSAFRYALRSEASLRFEKGQETRLARIGADRTAQLIVAWAGGSVAPGRVDTAPDEPEPGRVPFRPGRVDQLLGVDLSPAVQADLLRRVGVQVEPAPAGSTAVRVAAGTQPHEVVHPSDGALVAVVPTWRRDIEIEADVAEEIARLHGYDRIPRRLPETPMPVWRPSPLGVRDHVREVLAGAGLTEVVTHALVSQRRFDALPFDAPYPPAEGEVGRDGTVVRLANPLSLDHAVMRQTLLASLVDVVAANRRHGRDDVAVFELGKGYGRLGDRSTEWWRLAIAITGPLAPEGWNRSRRPADVDDLKGVVELLATQLGAGRPAYERLADPTALHPGRSLRLLSRGADGSTVITGIAGELHPAVASSLDLRGDRVILGEFSVAGLEGAGLAPVRSVPPPRYPAVERDLAVVVPEGPTSADVAAAIAAAAGPLLVSTVLFDVYRGVPLAPDERSLAYRMRFLSAERTLSEGEIDAAMAAISESLTERLGARIRS